MELLHHTTIIIYSGVDGIVSSVAILLIHRVGEHCSCIVLGTSVCRKKDHHGLNLSKLFLFVDLKENNNAKSNNEALFFLPPLDPCGD